jgi:hypothetical protein
VHPLHHRQQYLLLPHLLLRLLMHQIQFLVAADYRMHVNSKQQTPHSLQHA